MRELVRELRKFADHVEADIYSTVGLFHHAETLRQAADALEAAEKREAMLLQTISDLLSILPEKSKDDDKNWKIRNAAAALAQAKTK